jgi:hypothetical protein
VCILQNSLPSQQSTGFNKMFLIFALNYGDKDESGENKVLGFDKHLILTVVSAANEIIW